MIHHGPLIARLTEPATLTDALGILSMQQLVPFPPMTLVSVQTPPDGPDWVHSIKVDGYRFQCIKAGNDVRFFTRNLHDWSDRVPHLVSAVRTLRADVLHFDGEAVVYREDGSTDWSALRRAFAQRGSAQIRFVAFDMMRLDNSDLTRLPLIERLAMLKTLLSGSPSVVGFADYVIGRGPEVFELTRELKLEGVASKRIDSRYRAGERSRDWLKSKHWVDEALLICGAVRDVMLMGRKVAGSVEYAGSLESVYAEEVRTLPSGPCAFGDERASKVHWLAEPIAVEVRYSLASRGPELRQAMIRCG